MSKYVTLSKNDFYSFIIIVPLFILYQILGLANNYKSPLIVKNSADVYIKNFFQFFGSDYGNITYSLFFIAIMLFIFFKNKDLFMSSEIKLLFLFGMIAESVMHSISLLIIMSIFSTILPLAISFFNSAIVENIYLSIGAGLWEELLFRYIMISGSIFLLNKLMYDLSNYTYFIMIIISSVIFSFYHFIGIDMELINISIFLYRFIAGIILSVIFIFRGLGIAVYTHTFYDLYIVIFGG